MKQATIVVLLPALLLVLTVVASEADRAPALVGTYN